MTWIPKPPWLAFLSVVSLPGYLAAQEAPLPVDSMRGIAPPSGRPASVMIVNGTADPINPFEGGELRTESDDRIGVVRSSRESALYFDGLIDAADVPMNEPSREAVR